MYTRNTRNPEAAKLHSCISAYAGTTKQNPQKQHMAEHLQYTDIQNNQSNVMGYRMYLQLTYRRNKKHRSRQNSLTM